MRFSISRKNKDIMVFKDFAKPRDTGEITQFITELEIAKLELIKIFEKDSYDNTEDDTNDF